MNQFVYAVVALILAACSVSARPGYASPHYAPSYRSPAYAPVYGPQYEPPTYPAPYHTPLQPIAVEHGYHSYGAPAAPTPLVSAPSHPAASSAAAAQSTELLHGHYTQLAVPSYEFLSGDKINHAAGYAVPSGGY